MTLFVRSITSLVYAALLLGSLYINHVFFLVVVLVMATLVLWELQRITHQKIIILYLFLPLALIFSHLFKQTDFVLLFLGIIGVFFLGKFYWSNHKLSFSKLFIGTIGTLGVGVPLSLLILLGNQNPDAVAFFFGIIWLNDSGAYLVGSYVGKHKLAPAISPNKTIEGSIGGVVISAMLMMFFGSYFSIFEPIVMLLAILLTSFFGSLGDLIQSKIKRLCNVKDSGSILPGHGGMYDRLDSSLFALPVFVLILFLFGHVS